LIHAKRKNRTPAKEIGYWIVFILSWSFLQKHCKSVSEIYQKKRGTISQFGNGYRNIDQKKYPIKEQEEEEFLNS
jgi:hypothetical protein